MNVKTKIFTYYPIHFNNQDSMRGKWRVPDRFAILSTRLLFSCGVTSVTDPARPLHGHNASHISELSQQDREFEMVVT